MNSTVEGVSGVDALILVTAPARCYCIVGRIRDTEETVCALVETVSDLVDSLGRGQREIWYLPSHLRLEREQYALNAFPDHRRLSWRPVRLSTETKCEIADRDEQLRWLRGGDVPTH